MPKFEMSEKYDNQSEKLILHAEMDRQDTLSVIQSNIMSIVAKRLADDLYERYHEEILNAFKPKSIIKRVVRQFDSIILNKIKRIVK